MTTPTKTALERKAEILAELAQIDEQAKQELKVKIEKLHESLGITRKELIVTLTELEPDLSLGSPAAPIAEKKNKKWTKLTPELSVNIKKLLIDGELSYAKIAEQTNVAQIEIMKISKELKLVGPKGKKKAKSE